MNLFLVTVLATLVCGIYAPLPPIRGDSNIMNDPNFVNRLFIESNRKPLGPINRPPKCYDNQIMKDQVFDDTFICTDKLSYPTEEINYALHLPQNNHHLNYVRLSDTCFNDKKYYSDHLTVDNEYRYECVCRSNRRLITAVYYENQRCHIVEPEKQRIYYAFCEGTCNLGYGSIEGYYCVNKGWAERSFLVYCEANNEAFTKYTHGISFQNHGIGGFYYMKQTVPTYCGCRGYIGCDSGQIVQGTIG